MQGGAKKKNPYARTVQLTVWDAATSLGDELQEGKRFLVTNLVPSSKSAWRKPDDEAEVFSEYEEGYKVASRRLIAL